MSIAHHGISQISNLVLIMKISRRGTVLGIRLFPGSETNFCPFSSIFGGFRHNSPRLRPLRFPMKPWDYVGHWIIFQSMEHFRPNLAIFDLVSPEFSAFGSNFAYILVYFCSNLASFDLLSLIFDHLPSNLFNFDPRSANLGQIAIYLVYLGSV